MSKTKNFNIGQILLWWGSVASIPSGYHLCNGNMGTPDLRNVFILGASSTYDPSDTGGLANHRHHYFGSLHQHTFEAGDDIKAGTGKNDWSDHEKILFDSAYSDGRPPFHALCFIMKIN